MHRLKAQVRDGRLFLDAPCAYANGSVVELEVIFVREPSEPAPPHGEFDEAEADTEVGPIVTDDLHWASLSKPNV
jgi:hypothetical protein